MPHERVPNARNDVELMLVLMFVQIGNKQQGFLEALSGGGGSPHLKLATAP